MKKIFEKAVTMFLAVMMTVSAMSIGAFAAEDDIVLSILNEQGVMQDYTQAEIDALGGSVTGYDGMVVTPMSDEEIDLAIKMVEMRASWFAVNDNVVGYDNSYKPVSDYSLQYSGGYAYYNGSFSVGKNKEKYSNRNLTNLSNTVSLIIENEKDENGASISFNRKFQAAIYNQATGQRLMSLYVNTGAGSKISAPSSDKIYVALRNNNDFTANGKVNLSSY